MPDEFVATSMPDRDWWSALWPEPQRMLRAIGLTPPMTVLDLCCGDGYFTAPLARLVEGRVYALDLDPFLLDQAKAEVHRQGASVRQWICADARDVDELVPEPVDYVLMANTFHGVPDQAGLLSAIRSGLRANGRLGLVNWHPLPREQTPVLGQPRGPATAMRMSVENTCAIVEAAGFRAERIVELPPYHYGAVFERCA